MYGANVKSAHDGPPPDGHGGGPFTKACIDWRCLGTERDTFGQWRRNCGGRPECVAAAAPRNGLSGHNGAPPPPLKQHKRTSSDRGRVLDLLWAAGDRPPSPHPTARGSSVPSGGAPGGHISSSHHPGRSGTLCRSAPTRATAPTRSLPPSRPSISPTPRSPPSSLFPTPLVAPSLFLHPRPPPHPVASSARACDPPPFPPAPPPLPPQWRPA